MRKYTFEFIGTFFLVSKGTANNSFYGLAIGRTVLAMAFAFGRFSGGVFNSAVGLGLCVHKSLCWQNLCMFFVAPLAGGVFAAVVFLAVNEAYDQEPETIPEHPGSRTGDREPR